MATGNKGHQRFDYHCDADIRLLFCLYINHQRVNPSSTGQKELKFNQAEIGQKKQQQIIQVFSKQKLLVPSFYSSQNPIEKQLLQILNDKIYRKVRICTGVSGQGKSTAIKFLLEKRRKQAALKHSGQKFYYMDLPSQETTDQISLEELNLLLDGIAKYYRQNENKLKKEGKSPQQMKKYQQILVVDDINVLDKYQNQQQFKQLFLRFGQLSGLQNIKIILISNSSDFCLKLFTQSYIQKSCNFTVLQPATKDQKNPITEKIIQHYNKTEPINPLPLTWVDYFIDNGYTLRAIRDLIQSLGQQKVQIQDFIKQRQNFIRQNQKAFVKLVFKKYNFQRENKYDLRLIQDILSLGPKLQITDCLQMLNKLVNQDSDRMNRRQDEEKVLKQLDNKKLLICCHPRSVFARKTIVEILKQENQKSKSQKKS